MPGGRSVKYARTVLPGRSPMAILSPAEWSMVTVVLAFLAGAAVIGVLGSHLARVSDQLADVTHLGEAVFGAVFLGAATSLGGTVTSVTAAYQGFAEFAFSNAIGGIAAQTTFLAIADLFYRRANLEHAAASQQSLMQGALLCALLAIPLLAMSGPDFTIFWIHPASLAIFGAYYFGVRLIHRAGATPLWFPQQTAETHEDEPGETSTYPSTAKLWILFMLLVAGTAVGGYVVALSGVQIIERTGLSATVVGALFTAVATSLPELVTSVAAVRRGALTLAVGNIIGGNSFDIVFLTLSDIAYRPGSIYHAVGNGEVYLVALGILLTGILLLGLLRRERKGFANIGFESVLVLVVYVIGVVGLVMM